MSARPAAAALAEPPPDGAARVTFDARADGYQIARLGVLLVGHACEGQWGAFWLSYLPGPFGPQARPHRAATLEAACAALRDHVAAWVDAGGLAFNDGGRAIVAWHEGDRR